MIVDKIAGAAKLFRRRVWCLRCGHSTEVKHGLRDGWPQCCDHTMTIDHPSTRRDASDIAKAINS